MKKILIILILIVTTIYLYSNQKDNKIITIPNDSIRIRVIPSTNATYDQYMKFKVKTYIEENLSTLLKDEKDISKAEKIITDNISNFENDIEKIFIENDYQESVTLSFGNNFFPKKEYKGVVYNEGYYQSLVISIGQSQGDNWWCVLFPPLCLLEAEESTTQEYKFAVIEIINKIFA
ncbi:MAG: stage II sporulation protein R [bacterium]|nr:stage II sporulation protein R [bacterium]